MFYPVRKLLLILLAFGIIFSLGCTSNDKKTSLQKEERVENSVEQEVKEGYDNDNNQRDVKEKKKTEKKRSKQTKEKDKKKYESRSSDFVKSESIKESEKSNTTNKATTKQNPSKKQRKDTKKKRLSNKNDNYNPNFQRIKKPLPQSNSEERKEAVTHVVLHFSSYASVDPTNPYQVDKVFNLFKEYGVSAHYLIDRDGTIYELVHESRVAYHAGKGTLEKFPDYKDKLNHYSIGIELLAIGTKDEMLPMMSENTYNKIDKKHIGFTEAQYESVRKILKDLEKRYPHFKRNRNHIVGHDEYAKGRKTDPGSLFNWSKLGF